MANTSLTFFLNDEEVELDHVDPQMTLANYIRNGIWE